MERSRFPVTDQDGTRVYTVTHEGDKVVAIRLDEGLISPGTELYNELVRCFLQDRWWTMVEDSDVPCREQYL